MIGALSDCDIEKNYDVIKSHTKKKYVYMYVFYHRNGVVSFWVILEC